MPLRHSSILIRSRSSPFAALPCLAVALHHKSIASLMIAKLCRRYSLQSLLCLCRSDCAVPLRIIGLPFDACPLPLKSVLCHAHALILHALLCHSLTNLHFAYAQRFVTLPLLFLALPCRCQANLHSSAAGLCDSKPSHFFSRRCFSSPPLYHSSHLFAPAW